MFARKNCLNCHFCAKSSRSEDGREMTFPLRPQERLDARQGNYEFLRGMFLVCGHDQWHEGLAGAPDREKLKDKKCRHFLDQKVAAGMTFDAAKQELKSRAEDRQARWHKISVIGALFSLIFAAISAWSAFTSSGN